MQFVSKLKILPASKGIVKRDVVRVITPGTVIDQSMLDEKANNYLCCTYIENGFGMSYVDVSTGDLYVTENVYNDNNLDLQNKPEYILLKEEIDKVNPSEIISNSYTNNDLLNSKITCTDNILSILDYKEIILNHFNVVSLDSFEFQKINLQLCL